MKTTILSILVLTLISCDASTKDLIGTSWKVSELNQDGKKMAVTNDVILTIRSATEFSLKLDKNSCVGIYEITGKNSIKLGNLGCTELCCDSDFSMAVTNALYKVSTINFEKERATLSGDDVKIKFKKYEVVSNRIQMMIEDEKLITKQEKIPTKETTDVGLFVKPTEGQQTKGTIPEGDFITLYKSPCKGTCEEFTMVMYADGTVVYTGKFNAEIQGKHTVKLAKSESEALFSLFEQSNFTNFAAKYDDATIMDIQNTYLTYKGKKIHIRYKPNAPVELQALLEKVEQKAKEVLVQLKKK
ncbi:META domain-containing protein [Kordia sp. YSTF-M3]|uniref:META domain-containing protein n=1 Tax=Kordia aestuariivivens TaxID=2759037 RepID=A0ABR7Q7F3_9FLAO|nr:DUF6438 domain-containing protein [Kordia aestuariivivens]MBC8754496.1 META domain-containing protein [Kordia aestuariivivens]